MTTPEPERNINICVYDNPASWSRECWQNGKILYA